MSPKIAKIAMFIQILSKPCLLRYSNFSYIAKIAAARDFMD